MKSSMTLGRMSTISKQIDKSNWENSGQVLKEFNEYLESSKNELR